MSASSFMSARVLALVAAALLALPTAVQAQAKKAPNLNALLDQIEKDVAEDEVEQKQRIQDFDRKKAEQKSLLERAEAREAATLRTSTRLEGTFAEKEQQIREKKGQLKERMGSLGELFGIVRQVSGDHGAVLYGSIVSAELPNRDEFLVELGQSKALPSLKQLEKVWYLLQQEMTEQGKVVKFEAPVTDAAGHEQSRQVTRIGTFNLVSDGKYLSYLPETGGLVELPRQPAGRYTGLIGELENATEGHQTFGVDPTRGSLLALLVQTPDWRERLEAGGVVGYTILTLGALTAILGLLRLAWLLFVAAKVRAQMSNLSKPSEGNPLGRVLSIYGASSDADVETVERKLDEAVLRESGLLERLLWAVKVVSVVAPLMGLLGTVTGMIRTFQQITLFGAGDPKLMAGGISEALVTTMLGLVVAIPLVLIHSVLRTTSRRVTDVLQEQAAGLVASQSERRQG